MAVDATVSGDHRTEPKGPDRGRLVAAAPWWAAAMAVVTVAGLSAQYDTLLEVCEPGSCAVNRLDADAAADLAAAGVSLGTYATLVTAVATGFAVVLFALAALVRCRGDGGRLAVGAQWVFPALAATFHLPVGMIRTEWFGPLLAVAFVVNRASLIPALALFPDGRFVPKWVRGLVAVGVVSAVVSLPWEIADAAPPPVLDPLLSVASVGTLIGALVAQVIRYRHHADPVARGQIRWLLGGAAAMVVAALWIVGVSAFVAVPQHGATAWVLVEVVTGMAVLVLFAAITAALLRDRLWGVDAAVNRFLVWGVLSSGAGLLCAASVWAADRVGSAWADVPVLVVALAVGFLVVPVRARLQRAVDRAMYGRRDAPGEVARHLVGLEAGEPAALLDALAAQVASDLRLPGCRIGVRLPDGTAIEGAWGDMSGDAVCRELWVGSAHVGELKFCCRRGQDRFGPRDLDTIEVVTHQAATVAGMTRIAHELELARADVAGTRDEERRRLRRDLHDGLGPTLASVSQRIAAATDSDHDQRRRLLEQAQHGLGNALAEMRRIVHDLRPSDLDGHRLAEALHHRIDLMALPFAVAVRVDDGPGSVLPEKVEVALYRIVDEALYNAARHSGAAEVTVSLRIVGGRAVLEVADDGSGIAADAEPGVGLRSMQERTAALGGRLDIGGGDPQGTRITVTVPLEQAALR